MQLAKAKLQVKAEKPFYAAEKLKIFRIGGFAFRCLANI
jgi:hypothetical protein